MNLILSLVTPVALVASCAGFGAAILRISGAGRAARNGAEAFGLGFTLGMGTIGWILFFFGIGGGFSALTFWLVTGFGIFLLAFLFRTYPSPRWPGEITPVTVVLLAILIVVLSFDVLEGISPPADADTLAYHFSIPKQFVDSGRIEFVPRALSGAVPLLLHMTYAAALAMGGEMGLTLWAMVTGWIPAILVFGVARRSVDPPAAFALAVLFLTTPAVLYGGGSGQIEVMLAGIVLASAIVLVDARETGSRRTAAVAGILTGFFVGAKYFGLIYAGSAGLILLFHRRGIRLAVIFGIAATVAGVQWYVWNWWHTGDPVFPALFHALSLPDAAFWTGEYGEYSRKFHSAIENPLAPTVLNWLLYPVIATFDVVKSLESGRTGFGILAFLLLPLSLAGAVRRGFLNRTVAVFFLLSAIFFTVWFFSMTSQRVRHLLPVYPLLLVAGYMLAYNAARHFHVMRTFAFSVGLVLAIQVAGQGLFGSNYARFVFSNETREEFLGRNIGGAAAAFWINRNLTKSDKVGYMDRELGYLFDVPAFMLHPNLQALVDFRPIAGNAEIFIRQVQEQRISHFLFNTSSLRSNAAAKQPAALMITALIGAGCLTEIGSFVRPTISSRTLAQVRGVDARSTLALFKFEPGRVPGQHSCGQQR